MNINAAIDTEEHALAMLRAEGGTMTPRKREKKIVWPDNLTNDNTCNFELIGVGMGAKKGRTVFQSDNEDGDQGNKKRGATNLAKFGAKCAAQLGPRFKVEQWTYQGRNPAMVNCWHFDTADISGSSINSPPATLFEGIFSLKPNAGVRWVKHDAAQPCNVAKEVRAMLAEIEAEKQPSEGNER